YLFLAWNQPEELRGLMHASYGINDGHFDWLLMGSAATVVASMVAQIGEQVDFLRFMPEPKRGRQRWRWWAALIAAGPGWIVIGAAKMLGGAVLAFLVIRQGVMPGDAIKPVQMYLGGYAQVFSDPLWIMGFTCLFVIVSQVKILVTNAYAGSLAWSNFFSRLTHAHPGRLVWLVFNVLIGVALIKVGIFDVLEGMLGFYANFAVAWIGALVADLVVNKPLKLSPPGIEFRRAHLYDINPVGFVSLGLGTALALAAFVGVFGKQAQACSTVIGFLVAFCCVPLMAWATQGRYYIARRQAPFVPGALVTCGICEKAYESEDMAHCPAYGCNICSLCCTLDARCEDGCKPPQASLARQLGRHARSLVPALLRAEPTRRLHYLACLLGLALVVGAVLSFIVAQEAHILFELAPGSPARWNLINIKITCALALLVMAIGGCWLLLSSDSRRVAQDESNRQATLLREEIAAHEVTDRELQQARQAADRANIAKSRFLTNISHELRTPLNSILGYAQILERERELPAHRRAALGVIRRSGDHVVSLIDGLLDIARIETRRLRLVNSEIPFGDFLGEISEMFQLEARRKGIAFAYRPSHRLPPAVRGDRKRVAQVLINLLGNAVKYTARGQVAFRVDYANEIALMEVEDSGPGIGAADLERIFLPFERVEHSDGVVAGGVGLGLTIARMLVDLMGGELTVRSRVGQGTVFTIRLFLPAILHPRVALPPAMAPDVSGYLGPRRRVLVVDDAAVDRQLLLDVLEPLGFSVAPAASGTDALRIASQVQPDLVLMDIDMPGMDGWETVRLLRANRISLAPVLIVSANAFRMEPREDLGIARDDLFVKPVKLDDLLARMQAVLGLQWVASEAVPPAPTPAAAGLPAAELLALRELGEMGYVRGILDKLDELERVDPGLTPLTAALRDQVQRFDLAGYALALERIKEDTGVC
ncbi:MAG TPA: ATP-binding protein, partial [Pseudorhodoferax sp.]|nr:ATP-binding protein [Pseudorhodoferax sp.]